MDTQTIGTTRAAAQSRSASIVRRQTPAQAEIAEIPGLALRRLRDTGSKGTAALLWFLTIVVQCAKAKKGAVRASAERAERMMYGRKGLSRATLERARKILIAEAVDVPAPGVYRPRKGGGTYGLELAKLEKLLTLSNHAVRLGCSLIIRLGGLQAAGRLAAETPTRQQARLLGCSAARLPAAWLELVKAGLVSQTASRPKHPERITDRHGRVHHRYPVRVITVGSGLAPVPLWTAGPAERPTAPPSEIETLNPITVDPTGLSQENVLSSAADYVDAGQARAEAGAPDGSAAAAPAPPAPPVRVHAGPERCTPGAVSARIVAMLGGAAARPTERQSRRLARIAGTMQRLGQWLDAERPALERATLPGAWLCTIGEAHRAEIRAGTFAGSVVAQKLRAPSSAPTYRPETVLTVPDADLPAAIARDRGAMRRLIEQAREATPERRPIILEAAEQVARRLDAWAAEGARCADAVRAACDRDQAERDQAQHAKAIAQAGQGVWARALAELARDAAGAYDVQHWLRPLVPRFRPRQRVAELVADSASSAELVATQPQRPGAPTMLASIAQALAAVDPTPWTIHVLAPSGQRYGTATSRPSSSEPQHESSTATDPHPGHLPRTQPAGAGPDRPRVDGPELDDGPELVDAPAHRPAQPPGGGRADRADRPRGPRADAITALERIVTEKRSGWQHAARSLAKLRPH